MNLKTSAKYLLIYLLLNTIGFLLAFRVWWGDSLILSELNLSTIILLFSIGISWFGILSISVMISRKLILQTDTSEFISLLGLVNSEYLSSEIGIDKAKKLKSTISLIAFPLLLLTIISFIFSMKLYENNQLKNYGVIESVNVKEIHYDIKQNPYIYFEYQNKNHNTNLPAHTLKVNDITKIIYSSRNPKIIKYFDEYKNE
ncbi:hypothetical protein [Flavobacterium sp. PL02]|uniref:hypothetical protein n=1 Tax=Flavobacterium sp. PL02 TaxID=3088354 RepID=UPI002B225F00|nr:hypothetical protein [Flavobacterium sp. PL02]MEA9413454.1 hypothetical protein [Flavobacterium sp. PL02]